MLVRKLFLKEEVCLTRTRHVQQQPIDMSSRREHAVVERQQPDGSWLVEHELLQSTSLAGRDARKTGPAGHSIPDRRSSAQRWVLPVTTSIVSFIFKGTAMSQTLIAIFDSYTTANQAVEKLVEAGFSRSEMDVKTTDRTDATAPTSIVKRAEDDDSSSIGRFFSDLFGGDDDHQQADHYSEAVRRGHAVLTLRTDDARVDAAHTQLISAGAVNVDEQVTAWRGEGYTGGAASQAMTGQTGALTADNKENVIPLVEEQIEVGKRRVDQGRVRVVTRVETTPVHESVELLSERVVIECHAVDRPASGGDLDAFNEHTIEVRESAEQAVVSKTAHVVEEVVVGKQVSTETKQIDDTVRRTDVEVLREDEVDVDKRK